MIFSWQSSLSHSSGLSNEFVCQLDFYPAALIHTHTASMPLFLFFYFILLAPLPIKLHGLYMCASLITANEWKPELPYEFTLSLKERRKKKNLVEKKRQHQHKKNGEEHDKKSIHPWANVIFYSDLHFILNDVGMPRVLLKYNLCHFYTFPCIRRCQSNESIIK